MTQETQSQFDECLAQLNFSSESTRKLAVEADCIGELFEKAIDRQKVYLARFSEAFQVLTASAEEISVTCSAVKGRAAVVSDETNSVSAEVTHLVTITKNLGESKDQLDSLKAMMEEIAKSVQLINVIVDQTRLLSLNATIEAARAGDYGKGFAVVAQEVRALSQTAGTAAEAIRVNVERGQNSVNALVQQMAQQIDEAGKITCRTSQAFDTVSSEITGIASAVSQITAGAEEQSAALNASLRTLNRFTAMADQNTRIVGELGEVRHDLAAESERGIDALKKMGAMAGVDVEIKKNQSDFGIIEDVIASLRKTHEMNQLLQTIVKSGCNNTGWAIAHVLIPDASGMIKSAKIWTVEPENRTSQFVQMSESFTFTSGQGLPGRVYQAKKFEWIPDVTVDTNFPRAESAKTLGIVSGMAFPVVTRKGDVLAVVEYFARGELSPTKNMIHVLEQVGQIIGQVAMSSEILADFDQDEDNDTVQLKAA
jgi:hypothetical protein